MIDTLMAMWNRGYGSRGVLIALTFLFICISISLLLITAGSAWGALFPSGRSSSNRGSIVEAAYLTASAQPGQASPAGTPTGITPAASPYPCLVTPTPDKVPSKKFSPTAHSGRTRGRHSTPTPTATQTRPHPTQTPQPTPASTPTPVSSPSPSPSPSPVPTPTPSPTPTPVPTVTPTPGMTPTTTPTPGMTPTGTSTPTPTATPVPGGSPTDTPTVTASPTGAPGTPVATATSGTSGPNLSGGSPILPGTPSAADTGSPQGTNCFSDTIATARNTAALSILEGYFWVILTTSLAGTVVFCGIMYRLNRRAV